MLRVGPKEYEVGPNEDHGHDERNHPDAHDQPTLGLTPRRPVPILGRPFHGRVEESNRKSSSCSSLWGVSRE